MNVILTSVESHYSRVMGLSLESLIAWEQLFLWLVLIAVTFYFWSTRNYGYWQSKGVPFIKPVPLFGNFFKSSLSLAPNFVEQQECYGKFKDEPYVGTYFFMTPSLMLRDPRLIEQVMITDFSSFMDRATGISSDQKGLTAHLLNMTGARWKSLRTKLSPVFTSGKLKMMLEQLDACSAKLSDHLRSKITSGEPLEAKYLMSGYTMDVIGSCAFGLEFNAISDPDSTFRKLGETIFAPSKWNIILGLIRQKLPNVMRLIRSIQTGFNVNNYITDLIKGTIKHREDNNIQRNDFIQLLMDVRKQEMNKTIEENEVVMDDRVITSNSFVFLLAGFETTASTLSFLLYELAVNPEVQQRGYEEVVRVMKKHNGEITWESLKEMVYLQQAISETMRKYPPASSIRRTSNKPYLLNGKLELPAGSLVSIPVYSLHHDPQYFPNPEKFDPDRFSEENKSKIIKSSYLPFGDGPRICIGMRFALVEVKVAITRLLLEFSVQLDPRTTSPLKFNPGSLLLSVIGGVWLNFTPRKTVHEFATPKVTEK